MFGSIQRVSVLILASVLEFALVAPAQDTIILENDSESATPSNPASVRQTHLFVDDVMIASRSGLVRTAHAGKKLEQPVLEAEMPWEVAVASFGEDKRVYVYGTVLYEEATSQFRMWYLARPNSANTICYATSKDGVNWDRPNLGLVSYGGSTNNNILPITFHSPSVIYDEFETDSSKRYKMAGSRSRTYRAAYSPDGLAWTQYANPLTTGGAVCTLAQNRDSGEYLFFFKKTHKHLGKTRRLVYLSASTDMRKWSEAKLVMAPDAVDDAATRAEGGLYSEFYNMSAFSQGGQFLGLVTNFRYTGATKDPGPGASRHDGPIDVQIVSSRNGYNWQRCEDRSPVIANGPYDYDAGCILGVANGPVTVGDEQWIYYSGITTTHGGSFPKKQISVCRASWRRDGFVSLDADSGGGELTTLPFKLAARQLLVNAVTDADGFVRAELLNEEGDVIPSYDSSASSKFSGNSVDGAFMWSGRPIGDDLIGTKVRLRFLLKNASLYSFSIIEALMPGRTDGNNKVSKKKVTP